MALVPHNNLFATNRVYIEIMIIYIFSIFLVRNKFTFLLKPRRLKLCASRFVIFVLLSSLIRFALENNSRFTSLGGFFFNDKKTLLFFRVSLCSFSLSFYHCLGRTNYSTGNPRVRWKGSRLWIPWRMGWVEDSGRESQVNPAAGLLIACEFSQGVQEGAMCIPLNEIVEPGWMVGVNN